MIKIISDFLIIDPATGKPGNYFPLTANAPVTIPRTAKTFAVERQRDIFAMATTAFCIILTVFIILPHLGVQDTPYFCARRWFICELYNFLGLIGWDGNCLFFSRTCACLRWVSSR
mmetsp:Transcript_25224/g.36149  ORF Transcript_25224/g.36149 Transcript_25224/m.36149 type:complete len:116 (-) Transcript_25224:102-449(-)